MASRIVPVDVPKPKVVLEDAPKKRVDAAGLAGALGASEVAPVRGGRG